MRTITLFACMLLGLTAFSQTSITNILDDLQNDLRLGCCVDDEDNHPDFPDCIFPDYQEYVVNGDANINDNHLRISNADLVIKGNFYATAGAVTFSDNCNSTLFIEGDLIVSAGVVNLEFDGLVVCGEVYDQTALSVLERVRTIEINEPYIIYNSAGQMIKTGLYMGLKDIYSNEIRFIRFPRLNYSSKMVLKK